jgi:crotonobetainyl-CoA:carnitine CoA-transferase CaiB-like acyl-CoA transferase
VPPLDASSGEGLLFRALNRGKKSLTLDLKTQEGAAILLRLAGTADVLLESFRPGVMERLGLGYEMLARANPHLVYCSLSGYGREGSSRLRAGHDLNYVGLSGLLDLTGPRDGPPSMVGVSVADLAGALWAAVGILLALLERERMGRGQRVDGSLLGGALSFLPLPVACLQGGEPVHRGSGYLSGGLVCYNVYETQDGAYMTLSALEPAFWAEFCQAAGREDLLDQQMSLAIPGEPSYEEMCALFRSRTRQEWIETFAGVDACCDPVYSVEESLASAPVQALDMLTPNGLRPPVRLSYRQDDVSSTAPSLGQHTGELLAELGYDKAGLARLREQGVV